MLLNYENRNAAPVVVHPIGPGDLHELTLNPYTGEDFTGASSGVKSFFETIVGWHRWLGAQGKARGMGRMITGAANLIFAFLLITGIYLWLPKVWKWVLLRPKILFRRNPGPGKARDYNWHHAFSFWALDSAGPHRRFRSDHFIPLGQCRILSRLWCAGYQSRAARHFLRDLRKEAQMTVPEAEVAKLASLQQAVDTAKAANPDWKKINLFVHPKAEVPIARVIVHTGNGVLPEQMSTVVFDRRTAACRTFKNMTK